MYDCHYDLLTYIYMNKHNLNEVKEHCNKIFNENIKGGIFNLFYMSEDEMQAELGINSTDIDIIKNLTEVKQLIEKEKIIPEDIEYKIGIEGLDYLEKIEDIDILYKLGVRSVNPVWNNHNKFGTGVRPCKIINKKNGLTSLGKQLIYKLIQKGIAIDLSHSDEQTFWDIIHECRKYKNLKPKLLASHSNCRSICNVSRNLTDEQIKAIKEFEGIIGIVSIKAFCSAGEGVDYVKEYVKHIEHIKKLLGGVENIALATDDMSYYKIEPEYYQNTNIFKQEDVNRKITDILKTVHYTENEIYKIKEENYIRFWQ